MNSYQKLYNISKDRGLPDTVFLDKGNSFSFTVFLSSHEDTLQLSNPGLWTGPTWQPRGGACSLWGVVPGFKPLPLPLTGSGYQVEKNLAVAVVVADPDCLEASVNQEVLINRKAVLYKVRRPSTGAVPLVLCTVSGKPRILLAPSEPQLSRLPVSLDPRAFLDIPLFQPLLSLPQITSKDRKVCYDQGLSGHNLKKTSLMVKVWSKPGGGCGDGTLALRIRSISHSYPQVLGSSGKCFQTTYLGASMQVLELGYWVWYWEGKVWWSCHMAGVATPQQMVFFLPRVI